jgi:signal peptide peptidase SppA
LRRTTDKTVAAGLMLTTLAASITVIDTVWAVESAWWGQFKGARGAEVAPRADWFDGDDDDDTDQKPYTVEDGIAILNLSGVMTKTSYWWSGAMGTVKLRNLLRLCLQDTDVRAILLIVCSPGGQVAGTSDLAADIAMVGAVKPLMAFIEDQGCSAAYWAASQAPDGVYCNLTATVGSIGTIMEMTNYAEAAAWQGINTEQFTTGKYKGAGSPYVPMTDMWRVYFSDYVRAINASFIASVQTARKLSDAKMTQIRDAGVYVGQDAVAMGLVDGISTIDAVKATLKRKAAARAGLSNRAGKALAETDVVPAAAVPLLDPATISPDEAPSPESTNPAALATPEAQENSLPVASSTTGANAVAETLPPQHHTTMSAIAGRGTNMKNVLVNTLSALGLRKMAVAVVGVTSDDAQALAQAMAEQVNAEVADRVSNHPLVLGCHAAGIQTAGDLGKVLEMKALGERALTELRDDAKAHAVRAFGPEKGPTIGAQVSNMDYSSVRIMRDAWLSEADAKFGIGENGQPAARATAPKPLPTSASAEADADATAPKSAWEQLTDAQRKTGQQMGMKTPELQETFAKQYLNVKAA